MNRNFEIDLKQTIIVDCKLYEKIKNTDTIIDTYLYLNECSNSKESGLYQLILNGFELWYGTLTEINAVVKNMIKIADEEEVIQ